MDLSLHCLVVPFSPCVGTSFHTWQKRNNQTMQTEIRASLNSFFISLVLLWRQEVVLGEVPFLPVPKVKRSKNDSEFNWPLALLTLGTGQSGTSPRTTSRRHSSTSETKKELRLARISVCIVWLFLFCHVWKLVPTIYSTFIEVRTHHMSSPILNFLFVL